VAEQRRPGWRPSDPVDLPSAASERV